MQSERVLKMNELLSLFTLRNGSLSRMLVMLARRDRRSNIGVPIFTFQRVHVYVSVFEDF